MNRKLNKYYTNKNRLPKGNMWSAIPVALLCMVVNWRERKQGSGPKGNKVLQNTGEILFIHSFVCLSVPPPEALSGLKSTFSGLKSTFSGLKSSLSGLESEGADVRPKRNDFRLE